MGDQTRARFGRLRRRHLEQTRMFTDEAVARLSWSREQVLEAQRAGLRKLVTHAQEKSPYFRERLGRVEPATLEPTDLSQLPILTKAEVMEHWDELVTDPALRLEEVTRHLDDLQHGRTANAYYLDRYLVAATGGTSGKRGVFVWDWEMGLIVPNIHYRWEVRADRQSPPAGPKRTAVVCAGSYVHASRFLFPVMPDPERESRVFSAGLPIAEMVDGMNDYQPDRIVGYASVVEQLAEEALEGRLRIRPTWISTNSEPLEDSARALIGKAWGVSTHNTWGSVEIGIGAFEGPALGGMSLAEDFAIFEIVDDDDRPVAADREGTRVLVTKLYGSTMPIIRYEMTDTLVLDDGPNPDAPGVRRIKRIEGRADVWFAYGSTRIHPMVFRDILGQRAPITEYQVQQTLDGARVLAIAHDSVDLRSVESDLVRALGAAGLPDARVSVEAVAELPRHAETNKLKRFVPLPT